MIPTIKLFSYEDRLFMGITQAFAGASHDTTSFNNNNNNNTNSDDDPYFTSAERRVNMYIPEDSPLALPKPYGNLAPFKPSELGSSMRHYKKPKQKDLQV